MLLCFREDEDRKLALRTTFVILFYKRYKISVLLVYFVDGTKNISFKNFYKLA